MTNEKQMTEQEQQAWVKKQYQAATKHLADKGLVTESVAVEDSRYLIPLVAVWKLKLLDNTRVWVICGDLPTDHTNGDVATEAREAIRHFSLKWQLQAENLLKSGESAQADFAKLLIGRADGLYQLYSDDKLWANS